MKLLIAAIVVRWCQLPGPNLKFHLKLSAELLMYCANGLNENFMVEICLKKA